MKQFLLIITFLAMWGCSPKVPLVKEIDLRGTLAEQPDYSVACSFFTYATVFKFRCDTIYFGEYDQDVIYIIKTCPETFGDDYFEEEQQYLITATSQKPTADSVNVKNQYETEDTSLYWAKEIRRAE